MMKNKVKKIMLIFTLTIMMLLGGKAIGCKYEIKPMKEEMNIILSDEN
jgi:hypothetical protein